MANFTEPKTLAENGATHASPRIVFICLHAREVNPDLIVQDVLALRRAAWVDVGLGEAMSVIQQPHYRPHRLFHITADDGDLEDEKLAQALESIKSPCTFFVNSDVLATNPRHIEFYRRVDGRNRFAVEDHGAQHRKHFVSGHITGYSGQDCPATLRHLNLSPGMPVFFSASELSSREFIPLPKAMDFLRNIVSGRYDVSRDEKQWQFWLENELINRNLAYRRWGRVYVYGTHESEETYRARIRDYLVAGRETFSRLLTRPPVAFAYPWWQGASSADQLLAELGYEATFAGTNYYQPNDGRLFHIPRIYPGNRIPISMLECLRKRPSNRRIAVVKAAQTLKRWLKPLVGLDSC